MQNSSKIAIIFTLSCIVTLHQFIIVVSNIASSNNQTSIDNYIKFHLTYFNFPQSLAASSRGSAGPASRSEKHVLLLFVFVHRQELLLLGVEQSHHVAAFENLLLILPVLHEKSHLPGRGRVYDIDLLAARIVAELVIGGNVETLATCVYRFQNHLIADDHAVAIASQFVERHYVKPRALIAIRV